MITIRRTVKIGENFDPKKVFLATYYKKPNFDDLSEYGPENSMPPKELMETFWGMGVISPESDADVFYFDEDTGGYLRFEEKESILYNEEDLQNIVSIWNYYQKDQVWEFQNDEGFWAIGVTCIEPLERYFEDYK